jgi:hypothetical protein
VKGVYSEGNGEGGDALGVLLSFQLIYQVSLNLA